MKKAAGGAIHVQWERHFVFVSQYLVQNLKMRSLSFFLPQSKFPQFQCVLRQLFLTSASCIKERQLLCLNMNNHVQTN